MPDGLSLPATHALQLAPSTVLPFGAVPKTPCPDGQVTKGGVVKCTGKGKVQRFRNICDRAAEVAGKVAGKDKKEVDKAMAKIQRKADIQEHRAPKAKSMDTLETVTIDGSRALSARQHKPLRKFLFDCVATWQLVACCRRYLGCNGSHQYVVSSRGDGANMLQCSARGG